MHCTVQSSVSVRVKLRCRESFLTASNIKQTPATERSLLGLQCRASAGFGLRAWRSCSLGHAHRPASAATAWQGSEV